MIGAMLIFVIIIFVIFESLNNYSNKQMANQYLANKYKEEEKEKFDNRREEKEEHNKALKNLENILGKKAKQFNGESAETIEKLTIFAKQGFSISQLIAICREG